MTARLAKKIVTGRSRFTKSWSHVVQARARLRKYCGFIILPLTHQEFVDLQQHHEP